MSHDIQKPGTKQKTHGKNSAEKDHGEASKRARQESLLLCSFEKVWSFMLVLSDGLDAVQPLSLTAEPQCCLRLMEISSDIKEPAK